MQPHSNNQTKYDIYPLIDKPVSANLTNLNIDPITTSVISLINEFPNNDVSVEHVYNYSNIKGKTI